MRKKKEKKPPLNPDAKGFFLLALGVLGLVSLSSFRFMHPHDNWLGLLGYLAALGSEYIFGVGAYLIPLYLFWLGTRLLKKQKLLFVEYDHLYFLILLCSTCMLLNVFAESFPEKIASINERIISETAVLYHPYPHTIVRFNLGGAPFYYLYADLPILNLQKILSPIGNSLIFCTLSIVSFLLLTRVRVLAFFKTIGSIAKWTVILIKRAMQKPAPPPKQYSGLPSVPKINLPPMEKPQKKIVKILETPKKEAPKKEMPTAPIINTAPRPPKEIIPVPTKSLILKSDSSYKVPSPNLLSNPTQKSDSSTLKKDLMQQAAVLEETLRSFGIEAKVGEINSGPTITSFEVHPSIGVKVQKIKALENDIALNMQAKSIRIVAPIPGKAAVGVEVPAIHPQEVNFKELLLQYQQKGRKLQIPILLGKAVNGECVFTDLAKMPHCLIAGATGSGKSVCINTIVMSILLNARPDEIKLLMVDPKKVELTQYSRLPHMIAPVITEPHGAYAALQWLVKEMQVRYEILKQLGLRNITAFNNRKINSDFEASLNVPIPEHMPLVVAIVDEFADLMMVSSADIETPIARIAQMARAVGIHLILATQRPSREVITGIIKANIPTRISFKVASRVNSQIILDEIGAESLLGNGDLLFLPPGSSQLMRAQGAYISDDEINLVVGHICQQSPPNYLLPSFDSFRALDLGPEESEPKGNDPLYDQALTIVVSSKSASTTFLQRKLKIGYARAASLMDELEANGIIGPQEGARPRRVLSSSSGPAPDFLDEEEKDSDA
ncbi:MAG: DNA translocase FtsK 4TM domain-containing protein [Verrucomicrobiota bacterium]|nr:DNA translocase FtsK 4TM domain-containing protein [Verrucomicrobiota bacterium]